MKGGDYMKIGKGLVALGARMAAPLVHRIGTAFGGTMLGWGVNGDEVDIVLGALALIIGVAVDVAARKFNEGNN